MAVLFLGSIDLSSCTVPSQAAPPTPTQRMRITPAAALPPELATDRLLTAMRAELQRTADRLRLTGHEAPYYVAYAARETHKRTVVGKHGSVITSDATRTRQAIVDVRVGSYAFDNSDDLELDWVEEGVYEPNNLLPRENDDDATRHVFWLLTDLRYKQALSSYLKLKGQGVFRVRDPDRRPSFSSAPAVVHADPLPTLTFATEHWERVARSLSHVLGSDPSVFDSEVTITAHAETRWLVNTEGTSLRTTYPIYALHVAAYTRAEDGMVLDQSIDHYAPTEDGLPAQDVLDHQVHRLLGDLAALRAAPVLDPYTGPALLESAATGVFFHEVLGHRLEGDRQQSENDGQTFAKHLGQPIAPSFLSLHDDPTISTDAGQPLNGSYRYDEEGVAPERVTLVDRGVLRGFLAGRRPPVGTTRSNGHGRAESARRPGSRMGNLFVVAHDPVPDDRLRALLLEEVRRQGKPFGLIIRDISGGSTNTSSYGYQAFKGEARMVYKVDAATGAETLVRGVEIVGTPLATINKIIAAGTERGVFNGYCGAESGMVPVSTVAPATLFGEIELQRSAKPRTTGPILPPPPLLSPAAAGAP